MDIEIVYKIDKPKNLATREIQYFLKLLLLQDQVENPSVKKILSCPFICIAYENDLPIGIGAIKQIYDIPFDKAEIPKLKKDYKYELGYLYVLNKKKYRGQKIGKKICIRLLEMVNDKNVFATTEESDTNAMKFILEKLSFYKTGKTYLGRNTKKNIGLYLLDKTH